MPNLPTNETQFQISDLPTLVSSSIQSLLQDAIALNSTAYEDIDPLTKIPTFIGSKTETALLGMSQNLGWKSCTEVRKEKEIVRMFPFSSEEKMMGVVVKKEDGKGWRLMVKGASEILLKLCESYVEMEDSNDDDDSEIKTLPFDEESRSSIDSTILSYASQSLRTIAICYRDFPTWPPSPSPSVSSSGISSSDELSGTEGEPELNLKDNAWDMTLLSVAGIEDPLRPGVLEAVEDCQRAGVKVVMVTGDNPVTAR